ncbi:MAG: chitosanase [Rhodocyclales bacterium]|nr:chitosanase [Rhodocyclales bacterium]
MTFKRRSVLLAVIGLVFGMSMAASAATRPVTSHDSNFSTATLDFLWANTALDGEQWDNIMKLVNKPEQDSLNWVKAYSYCQNIGDNRGFTIGIVGATTGGTNDTGPDGPALFKNFDALKGATSPTTLNGLKRLGITATMSGSIIKFAAADISGNTTSKFCTAIKALQNDAAWRAAIWQTAYNAYIKVAMTNAKARGYKSAATIGSFFDTALNQGGEGDANSLQGLINSTGSAASESAFMLKFHNLRLKVVNTNDYNQAPNGTNRVKQWMQLFTDGELDLKGADAEVVKVTGWTMQ